MLSRNVEYMISIELHLLDAASIKYNLPLNTKFTCIISV